MRIAGKGKKINISLQLSRGNQGVWCLDFEDTDSRLLISRISIPNEEISNLISTRTTAGTAELFINENFGKQLEVRTVLLDLERIKEGLFELKTRIKLWENQNSGWKIDEVKEINWNKHRNNNKYELIARRYV
jgi:hypothetical protein